MRLKTYVRERRREVFLVSLVLISFALPFCMLFSINPTSFSRTWTGRTFYLFFIWLILLEIILDWDAIMGGESSTNLSLESPKTILLAWLSALPAMYVFVVNFLGGEYVLRIIGEGLGIPFAPIQPQSWIFDQWVLSLEYLVLAALFGMVIWVAYRKEGLKIFAVSLLFLGAIGTTYMIDALYPFGYFTPFQAVVPTTASLAAGVLGWLGYQTSFTGYYMGAPILAAYDSSGTLLIQYAVGWPCAGVQSLLIYTFVVLIFLKKTAAPLSHKAAYFIFGAFVTYLVNILRVVSIYLTYINTLSQGRQAALEAARVFHDFYGGLYSMAWIVAYPLIIVGSRSLWHRITDSQTRIRLRERSIQRENMSSSAPGN